MVEDDSGRETAAPPAPHTVTDTVQADLLTTAESQHYFRPFLARDVTASAVAAELGSDLNRVLYRIRTFLAAGLIKVVREEPRRGRAVKVYRSVHDAYFIPFEVTTFGTLEDRLLEAAQEEMRMRIRVQAKHMRDRELSGQHLYRDASGETWTTSAPADALTVDHADVHGAHAVGVGEGSPLGSDFWTDVYLSEEEAMGLQRRLWAELQAFAGRRRPIEGDGPPRLSAYHFNVSLVKLDT